jgi:hypothetical protein
MALLSPILFTSPVLIGLGCLFLAILLNKVRNIGRREKGLPPRPPTIPIFGNMLQIPITQTKYQ